MKSKMKYSDPEIVKISLDNAIALQLASDADPLGEPDWVSYNRDTQAVNQIV